MNQTDGRLVGILGTVIIHLIVGIMIMGFKISELHTKSNLVLDLELFTEFENRREELLRLPELSATSVTTVERALQGDEELLNIARNLTSRVDPNNNISRDDYIDMVKDEMIRSGMLGTNNYIDQQKQQSANNDNNVPIYSMAIRNEVKQESSTEQNIAANYTGETSIYYALEGRTHTHLPPPIYKCQGAGIITLRIEVNPKGDVEKATVLTGESVTDQCLIETAINTALVSRFNSDINAPRIQTGTLTFHFVAQ
jgi:hypothetical protein